jgi:hypothetical protein
LRPARSRARCNLESSEKAISLFGAKKSLFGAEQGIRCNSLMSHREKVTPWSKQPQIGREIRQFPVKFAVLRECMITYRTALALCLAVVPVSGLAFAMVGGALPADPAVARHVVLLVGSRGNSCSGVAIARDLVLTAAHCVLPGADYKLVIFDAAHQPQLNDITTVTQLSDGCGGLTGVTPLARYRTWIVDTAAKMGSVLAP